MESSTTAVAANAFHSLARFEAGTSRYLQFELGPYSTDYDRAPAEEKELRQNLILAPNFISVDLKKISPDRPSRKMVYTQMSYL